MSSLLADMTSALRALRRTPGFTAVATLTLAIGIGAATTIASVADSALLRPLPYPDGDRLMTVLESNGSGGQRLASYPTFRDWQAESSNTFDGLSFVRGSGAILKDPGGAERVTIAYVSTGYFGVMGASPLLGRTFDASEERTDAGNSAVLSHDFWSRKFGGDRSVIGRTLSLDAGTVTIIGVMPAGTTFPAWADMWRPLAAIASSDAALAQRDVHSDSRIVARVRRGTTIQAATSELNAVASRVAARFPADGWRMVALTPLRSEVVGDVTPMLLALAAAVALGLLIACVNVANLSLVRAAARARDVAVRLALGATRRHIVRQLFAESMVLALVSGVFGVLLTVWATAALRSAAPAAVPRAAELVVDARVLAVAVLLSMFTALLCGIAPAIGLLRADVAGTLRDGRSAGTSSRRGRRVQSALTVAQFALALVLLVGAGLLVQSFRRAQHVDVGFDPSGVLALRVIPPSPRYDGAAAAAALYERLIAAARQVPGIEAAAFTNHAPLGNAAMPTQIRVPGRATDTSGADGALYKTVSPDYLRLMRIPLQQGRWFTDGDMTASATGVVVSDEVAKRYWPNENPIGRSITIFKSSQARADFGAAVHAQVIGVVGSVRHFGMETQPAAEVYVPYTSEPWAHGVLLVRTRLAPASVIPSLRKAIAAVDAELPLNGAGQLAGIQPLDRNIDALLASRRWMMSVVAAFAGTALLLAALGIYGVTAYAVSQRVHEIGVRMALGATRERVVRMIVRRGVVHAALGVMIGLAGSLALTRLLEGLLFATSAREPSTFIAVSVVLAAVATVACYLPARRAARVDPVVALRAE